MRNVKLVGFSRPLTPIPECGPAHHGAAIGPITKEDWGWLLLASLTVLSTFLVLVVGGVNVANAQATNGSALWPMAAAPGEGPGGRRWHRTGPSPDIVKMSGKKAGTQN